MLFFPREVSQYTHRTLRYQPFYRWFHTKQLFSLLNNLETDNTTNNDDNEEKNNDDEKNNNDNDDQIDDADNNDNTDNTEPSPTNNQDETQHPISPSFSEEEMGREQVGVVVLQILISQNHLSFDDLKICAQVFIFVFIFIFIFSLLPFLTPSQVSPSWRSSIITYSLLWYNRLFSKFSNFFTIDFESSFSYSFLSSAGGAGAGGGGGGEKEEENVGGEAEEEERREKLVPSGFFPSCGEQLAWVYGRYLSLTSGGRFKHLGCPLVSSPPVWVLRGTKPGL